MNLEVSPRAPESQSNVRPRRVLVTGGTGFVGRPLVQRLVAAGYEVRVLTRSVSKAEAIQQLGANVCVGDVADLNSFSQAVIDCEIVVHLAAGTSGSEEDSQSATLRGTRNLLTLCARHAVKRLVYISSCSVYGTAHCRAGANISETSDLEHSPELRGFYAASKLEAESYVRKFAKEGDVPTVVLRPGAVYGPGGQIYTPAMGFAAGSLYGVIGDGGTALPLVYVENLVDAMLLAMEKEEAVGGTFNVVDAERVDKRMYIDRIVRRLDPRARVLYVPYFLVYGLTWLQEQLFGLMRRSPVLTRYRLMSSQRRVQYDSSLISTRLGWRSTVSVAEAIERLVASARPLNAKPAARVVQSDEISSMPSRGPAAPGSAG